VSGGPGLPGELKKAMAQRPAAQAAWDKLPPSHKAEYLKWIAEAKGTDAKARRASQTVARITG
jgi:uncharacterized protein YdeI (YjbR/CyaY-like superfamily)